MVFHLGEKPWFVLFELQEKVLKLFSVSIYPRQTWATVAFVLFSTILCPALPLLSHQSVTHSEMPKANAIFSMKPFLILAPPPQAQLIIPFLLILNSIQISVVA